MYRTNDMKNYCPSAGKLLTTKGIRSTLCANENREKCTIGSKNFA